LAKEKKKKKEERKFVGYTQKKRFINLKSYAKT